MNRECGCNLWESNAKFTDSIFLMREKATSVACAHFYGDCAGKAWWLATKRGKEKRLRWGGVPL